MSSTGKNWLIIVGVAFSMTLFCAIFLKVFGTTDADLLLLLRITARIALLIFLVVFIARPLRTLLVNDTTRWLLRERRSFGLAFASVHTVHAGVIMLRANMNPDFEVIVSGNLFGALIYLLILAMVITSFDGPARALGSRNWRWLHKTGLYVVGFAFLQTIVPHDITEFQELERIAIVTMAATAILIRLTAFLKK